MRRSMLLAATSAAALAVTLATASRPASPTAGSDLVAALGHPHAAGALEPPASRQAAHLHVALRVLVGDTLVLPPRGVGVTPEGRLLAIHTHDASGILHVHQPSGRRPLQLRDALAAWSETRGQATCFTTLDGRRLAWPAALRHPLADRQDWVVSVGAPARLPPYPFARHPAFRR